MHDEGVVQVLFNLHCGGGGGALALMGAHSPCVGGERQQGSHAVALGQGLERVALSGSGGARVLLGSRLHLDKGGSMPEPGSIP